jgi:ribonuclease R
LSACEQRSVKAERQVISIKKARFIRRFIGQEFEGTISSVTKFGVFVLLRQYDVDGLLKLEQLGDDRFVFDEENLRLIGQRRGIRYSIGESVKVRVAGADTTLGKVDFELAEEAKASMDDEADTDDFDDFAATQDHRREHGSRRNGERHGDKKQVGGGRRQGGKGKPGVQTDGRTGGRSSVADESQSQKRKGLDPQKRRAPEDNRGRVRKERFPKRRRKD